MKKLNPMNTIAKPIIVGWILGNKSNTLSSHTKYPNIKIPIGLLIQYPRSFKKEKDNSKMEMMLIQLSQLQ